MDKLIPIEQKQIKFQNSTITAVMVQNKEGREDVYIPMKQLAMGMGLSWSSQRSRIKRNPSLKKVLATVFVMNTEGGDQRRREVLCLPISHLNGFLFGINAKRVKPEIREALIAYQDKCYEVLFSAFNGTESMTRFYSAIGHDISWIEKRIQKHHASTSLGDVWLLTGVPIEKHEELQNLINSGVFGLSIAEHKQLKGIGEGENLPDNMTRLELLFSGLGDETAIHLAHENEAEGLDKHTQIAKAAGDLVGEMRAGYEKKLNINSIASKSNNLVEKRPSLDEKRDN